MAAVIYFLLCLATLSSCEAYKMLVVFGMPSKSHSILGGGVVRHLLKDGHEVTYVTPFEYKNPPPNLRLVNVSSNAQYLPTNMINLKNILSKNVTTNNRGLVRKLMTNIATKTVEHEEVQKLLNDLKEQFDVVIVEWMFTDLLSGFAAIFDCPLIWVSPVDVNSGILSLIDSPPSPTYASDPLSSNTPPFNFYQRVEELWMRITGLINGFMYDEEMETQEYKRLIEPLILKRGRTPPPYNEVRYNASLMLGNSHVSMGIPLSLPQSYKPIGGYHIEEETSPLPQDLERIMMNAKNGVIYFSMGSNLKSKDWPEDVKEDLLKMFGGLQQTVLWKFEEDLPNKPKNVHILKWAPQPSILSHPKCVLFITHGGLLSTTESIHYGVPTIGIPVFGDQFSNVLRSVRRGFALEVNLSYNVTNDLKVAIEEMLHNPKYRQKVKELSFVYHDRIAKPGAELVHWVKHVVSTRGAPHLRSPALLVPLYQLLYLDLAALIAVILVILLILLKVVCSVLCSKKKVDVKKKNR